MPMSGEQKEAVSKVTDTASFVSPLLLLTLCIQRINLLLSDKNLWNCTKTVLPDSNHIKRPFGFFLVSQSLSFCSTNLSVGCLSYSPNTSLTNKKTIKKQYNFYCRVNIFFLPLQGESFPWRRSPSWKGRDVTIKNLRYAGRPAGRHSTSIKGQGDSYRRQEYDSHRYIKRA